MPSTSRSPACRCACIGGPLKAGAETALSVRQHEVHIMEKRPETLVNMLPARVIRNVFLGNSRDYMVALVDGTTLRAVAPPDLNVAQGAEVWLHLPPLRCRALLG